MKLLGILDLIEWDGACPGGLGKFFSSYLDVTVFVEK